MKEQLTKFTSIDLNDANLKIKLYLKKLNDDQLPIPTLQKICHLAVENFIRFIQSQEFVKDTYEHAKSFVFEKKSYYALYIIDCFLKNSKFMVSMAKKDLETMFKTVWQKIYSESKKDPKLDHLKCMVKTWGVIYPKKNNIEESLKKWLQEKYSTDLTLSQKYKALFEESYEPTKHKTNLIEPIKKIHMQIELDPRLFDD